MTTKLLNETRDRLAWAEFKDSSRIEASHAFKAGFDAAVRLCEEQRVKPLREALHRITLIAGHGVICSDKAIPYCDAGCEFYKIATAAIAQVPELEE